MTESKFKRDWFLTTIGSFCPFSYGKGLPEKKRNKYGKVKVFGSNGHIGYHDQAYINGPGIIIGRKGTVGAVHYVNEPFWPIDTTFYVLSQPGQDLRFTYYLLKSLELSKMNSDSAVPGLNRETAHSQRVYIPSYEDQKTIAHILGTLDDKIELNHKMNETLEAIARAIFKSWFVDFDPVHENIKRKENPSAYNLDDSPFPQLILDLFPDSFQDSELGQIPKEWEVKSLEDIANYLNGLPCQKYPPMAGKESLPVIKIRELRQGITYITDRASSEVPKDYVIEDGDVLFSWSGSLFLTVWTGGKGILNQHLFKVSSDIYPKWFYYYWIEQHLNNFIQIAADKATTMGHIQRRHLSEAKVIVPGQQFFELIDKCFNSIFDLIIRNDTDSQTMDKARNYLLPRLISGELKYRQA
jgi:type I restriction enzyme S subunit